MSFIISQCGPSESMPNYLFSKASHIALMWLCFFAVHCVIFIESLPFFNVTCISNSVLRIFHVLILCVNSTVTVTGITTGTSCFRICTFSQLMVTVSHKQCFVTSAGLEAIYFPSCTYGCGLKVTLFAMVHSNHYGTGKSTLYSICCFCNCGTMTMI